LIEPKLVFFIDVYPDNIPCFFIHEKLFNFRTRLIRNNSP